MTRRTLVAAVALAALLVTAAVSGEAPAPSQSGQPYQASRPDAPAVFEPMIAEWQFLSASATPPTEASCFAAGRRCFSPGSMAAAYNYGSLFAQGIDGTGMTIAVIDAYGSANIAHDLHVFNQAFGLRPMCGEEGVTCAPGMPTFSVLALQGSPPASPPPPNNGTGLEDRNAWSLEVSLDVQWAHATAPGAKILLVTTPTAETLGVQGFPQMMNALEYVVTNGLADVVSMSFAAAEATFSGGTAALMQLRKPFLDAMANGVTLVASSGDNGTANVLKTPVKNPRLIPYPSVEWPASDPLVTAVGGTYLCTDPVNNSSRVTDSTDPPTNCTANPGVAEIGWIASGGGFSQIFPRPSYQDVLPPGSTTIGVSTRGVPDVAYQASARTGVLVYDTTPDTTSSGVGCGGSTPCSSGWYVVGGTSTSAPQWAGLIAMAGQLNGGSLGFINPALYRIGADPVRYASDFFDVTTGNNQLDPSVPGYPATRGWDPVTGLGTPNAANLVPDLVLAVHGH